MIANCLQSHADGSKEHKKPLKKRAEHVTALVQHAGDGDDDDNKSNKKAANPKSANQKAPKGKQLAQKAGRAEALEAACHKKEEESVATAQKRKPRPKKAQKKRVGRGWQSRGKETSIARGTDASRTTTNQTT
jgi:hypothetical protein